MKKQDGQVQRESKSGVSDDAINTWKERFTEAIEANEVETRVAALEEIIADCAMPLKSGTELGPEYSAFLVGLTRMHMLEKARLQLAQLAR